MIRVGIALRNFTLLTGVSRVAGETARRLPAHGFEPLVFAHKLPVEPLPGASAARLPLLSISSWTRAASFDWLARRRLAAAGVKLVHGHGDLTRQDVLSVHNCDAAAARYVPDGRRSSGGVRYVRDRQFRPENARVIVADSEMVRRDVCAFYGVDPARVRRVYYGVDLERFHPARRAAARAALLKRAGWPEERRIVLSVLSGDPAKRNFPLLTKAALRLAEREPAALCVVGKVDWRQDETARRLDEKGLFLHVPATPGVQDYFAAADAFALPAFYEEFGLTVLEALASGCPVAVSARAGAAELIEAGKNGRVFSDMADPEELVEALRACLSLPDRGACRKTAEAFTWDRHVREIAAIYREVL